MKLDLKGDWALAGQFFQEAHRQLGRAIRQSPRPEAELLKQNVLAGIDSGAPGGQRLAPLAQSTRAIRSLLGVSSRQTLVATGLLRNSIQVWRSGPSWMVGVVGPRAALVETLEKGITRVIRMTEQQRRWLFANLGRAIPGVPPGGGGETIVQKVPPRPFLTPVYQAYLRDATKGFRVLTDTARSTGTVFARVFGV